MTLVVDFIKSKVVGNYPSDEAAKDHIEASDLPSLILVAGMNDLNGLAGGELLRLYNTYAAETVAKFATKKDAMRRTWNVMAEKYKLAKVKETMPSSRPKPTKTAAAKPPVKTAAAKPPVKTAEAKPPVKTAAAKPPVKTAAAKPPVKTAAAKPPVNHLQKKVTVSSIFVAAIKAGKGKEETLAMVADEFPDKDVPDSYYAWYVNKMKKAGEI